MPAKERAVSMQLSDDFYSFPPLVNVLVSHCLGPNEGGLLSNMQVQSQIQS